MAQLAIYQELFTISKSPGAGRASLEPESSLQHSFVGLICNSNYGDPSLSNKHENTSFRTELLGPNILRLKYFHLKVTSLLFRLSQRSGHVHIFISPPSLPCLLPLSVMCI